MIDSDCNFLCPGRVDLTSSFSWEFPYTSHSSVDTCLSTLVRDDSHKLVIPSTHFHSLPTHGQHWLTTDGPAPALLGELQLGLLYEICGWNFQRWLPWGGGELGEICIWDGNPACSYTLQGSGTQDFLWVFINILFFSSDVWFSKLR